VADVAAGGVPENFRDRHIQGKLFNAGSFNSPQATLGWNVSLGAVTGLSRDRASSLDNGNPCKGLIPHSVQREVERLAG